MDKNDPITMEDFDCRSQEEIDLELSERELIEEIEKELTNEQK